MATSTGSTLKLTIATPEKRFLMEAPVEEVTIPGWSGELNILPGHAPLMTTLETGILKYKIPGKEVQERLAISWGYAQVYPGGVSVLAEVAETPESVDKDKSLAMAEALEKKLGTDFMSDEEFEATIGKIQLARAEAEISQFKK